MGLFDAIKKMTGGGTASQVETVKGPTRVLREAGIDTTCLDCKIGADGSVTISGIVESDASRDEIISVLEGMSNISGIINEINVAQAPPETTADEAAAENAAEPETASKDAGHTYTVQSGDTLWKISQEMYGNGSKYMKIFEANTPMLENPDRLFPGQELVIPELED